METFRTSGVRREIKQPALSLTFLDLLSKRLNQNDIRKSGFGVVRDQLEGLVRSSPSLSEKIVMRHVSEQ